MKPDDVGKMVQKAVEANRLYNQTDRVMFERIQARTKEMLDAMPDGLATLPPNGLIQRD